MCVHDFCFALFIGLLFCSTVPDRNWIKSSWWLLRIPILTRCYRCVERYSASFVHHTPFELCTICTRLFFTKKKAQTQTQTHTDTHRHTHTQTHTDTHRHTDTPTIPSSPLPLRRCLRLVTAAIHHDGYRRRLSSRDRSVTRF